MVETSVVAVRKSDHELPFVLGYLENRETHTHIKKGKSKKESVHLNYLINIRLEITVQCLYSVHSINHRKTNVVFEYFILSKGKSSNN